jgi:hypothetical protein
MMSARSLGRPSSLAVALVVVLVVASSASATPFMIVPTDGAGVGFNDTTPVAPVGGNPGTTLGEQRLNVYVRAGQILGDRLGDDNLTIVVDASFAPLACMGSQAVLGMAGAKSLFRDFSGAPRSGTWYPSALADQLAGSDMAPSDPDIVATFSSNLDEPDCFGDNGFYYGFDGKPPSGDIDFLTVLMHELSHGLGFASGVNPFTGAKAGGYDDAYMIHMRDESQGLDFPVMTDGERMAAIINTGQLVWTGTNVNGRAVPAFVSSYLTGGIGPGSQVLLYAPPAVQQGSSQSHFDTSVSPDEIMEPIYTAPNHNTELTFELMKDLGYSPIIECGDANRDGSITATDALTALRSAVGSGNCLESLCDPDSTGTVTATDALIILKRAVGQSLETSCGLAA